MYDTANPHGSFLCDKQVIRPRLQSDCQEGEGLTIDFKHRDCMHDNLRMGTDLVQHFNCVAHWENGRYTFIIIRPSSGDYKAWCLRLTNPIEDLHEGHLFIEFVCDPGVNGKIEETTNYLKINFVKRVISSICADASVDCEPRWCEQPELRTQCPQTCGDCSGETDVCPFKESFYGSWIESADTVTNVMKVSVYDLYLGEFYQLQCLNNERELFENRTVLWQIFDNGCFPRLACLEMEKISSSVLQYRFGKAVAWPIPPAYQMESAVCHSDQFQHNDPMPMKAIVHESTTHSVNCNLPMNFDFSNNGIYIDNDHCSRCLSYSRSTSPTVIMESSISCSVQEYPHQVFKHKCLASIVIGNDTTGVLTKQRHHIHHKHKYHCWVFTMHRNRNLVFRLGATHCNVDMIRRISDNMIALDGRYNVHANETEMCPYFKSVTLAPTQSTVFVPSYKYLPTKKEPTTKQSEQSRQNLVVVKNYDSGSSFVHTGFNMWIWLMAMLLFWGV